MPGGATRILIAAGAGGRPVEVAFPLHRCAAYYHNRTGVLVCQEVVCVSGAEDGVGYWCWERSQGNRWEGVLKAVIDA
jgi:hypothetical protein